MSIKIAFIPDTQVKPGVPIDHLEWLARYLVEKRPDVIVQAGDFADMASLSSYDKGKRSYEGRRYTKDIDSAKRAMERFCTPIAKTRGYSPRLVLTLGNHEQRIERAIEDDPSMEGKLSINDLGYKNFGWEVHSFLKPVKIAGFTFSHYFPSGQKGLPIASARMLLTKIHASCLAGHQQGLDQILTYLPDGRRVFCAIAGSFYQHKEEYLNYMTNFHWRGFIMLHEAKAGEADPMFVSLNYLKRRYKK